MCVNRPFYGMTTKCHFFYSFDTGIFFRVNHLKLLFLSRVSQEVRQYYDENVANGFFTKTF